VNVSDEGDYFKFVEISLRRVFTNVQWKCITQMSGIHVLLDNGQFVRQHVLQYYIIILFVLTTAIYSAFQFQSVQVIIHRKILVRIFYTSLCCLCHNLLFIGWMYKCLVLYIWKLYDVCCINCSKLEVKYWHI